MDGRYEEREYPPTALWKGPTDLRGVPLINDRSMGGVFGQFIRSMVSPLGQLMMKESWNYGGGTDNMPRFFGRSAAKREAVLKQLTLK